MRILLLCCIAVIALLGSSSAQAVQVNFLGDNDDSIYTAQNSTTRNIDCIAPAICNVAPGRYRLIGFDSFHSVYVTVENDGSVRYTYDGGADFPYATAAGTPTEPEPEPEPEPGTVQVNFLSDNDDSTYAAQNTTTRSIDCIAPAICNVAPGRYRLIGFDSFHSVYVTVENDGSVRYTYDGGADFPYATAAGTPTEPEPDPIAYDYWPNPASKVNGDQWLTKNHENIKLLNPKVLAVSFGNDEPFQNIQTLVNKVVAGFSEGSRMGGNTDSQLQYEVTKIIDLRDGVSNRPSAPANYPYLNSTLYPRGDYPANNFIDYSAFFSDEFASYYGYTDPANPGEYLPLCELIESGEINELWFVGSANVPDASAYEVLEWKQRYNDNRDPITNSFERCAGNGCFSPSVPRCERSVRIGFINQNRGSGCYLHSMGHAIESTGARQNVIPDFSEWFVPFAGFDLNTRFGMPFSNFYNAANCFANNGDYSENCLSLSYPTETSINVQNFTGYSGEFGNYLPTCGNVHFPPNARRHYDQDNTQNVQSNCQAYGSGDTPAPVSNTLWEGNSALASDCGGEFLVWWYQQMPGYGSNKYLNNGDSMLSPWPFLFY